ncbi:hypothetical protein BDK51DRAFT_15614 [Blyttiomyces helicus]|uniref:Uncharacterized protein n=1 Tax=Blyttiomyces helicus TaxID=388810 RepID=A0A4V1IQL6_9FUNG|nr:hypothetical protein BDK51DRAFT_15614 [Blyttiomyces helicus]|eukprot:RKO86987.1 hypothetical protein BDK51DRAFT_15614 [Blyttiomyces helicus]
MLEAAPWVYFAVGVHPHAAVEFGPILESTITSPLTHPRCVALGETGLDYFRMLTPAATQLTAFTRQLRLGLAFSKPLVIHSRDAEPDTLATLTEIVPRSDPIHMHCFTGSAAFARDLLEKFEYIYFGFTGVVTYHTAGVIQGVVERVVPLDRILLETDAPYMPPVRVGERKGGVAHCGMVPVVAGKIAELKGVTVDEVIRRTRANARAVYGI